MHLPPAAGTVPTSPLSFAPTRPADDAAAAPRPAAAPAPSPLPPPEAAPRDDAAARQRAQEQETVDALYAHLDAELARVRDDVARTQRDREDPLREPRLALANRRARTLAAAEHHLCFGRLDTADGTVLRIGRTSFTSPDGTPLLVDWRAAAARAFYAATPAEPLGLRRRRHLSLDGRRVTGVSDELLGAGEPGEDDVVSDGPLAAALGARRTGRMRDVVATLQAEQDAIVRSPHRGVTVVEGGPGTGKTVVALHRAAYVLAMFDAARADGVLVLGPGRRFLDYIGGVLPSLGETDVAMATPGTLLEDAFPAIAGPGLRTATPARRRRLGDPRWARRIADAVAGHQAPRGTQLAVVIDGDSIALRPGDLAELRATAQATGLPHHRAREVFRDLVAEALADEVEARARVFLARMDEDIETLTGGANVESAVAKDLERLGFEADEGGKWAHKKALAELDPDALRASLAADPSVEAAVEQVWPRLTAAGLVTELLGRKGPWVDAHLPLVDEAAALIDGPPVRTFGHVVVDEAQELTPMQWRAVARRCPARSMTIVGDLAQAGPATGAPTWDEALGNLARRAQVHTLTVCYRTTAQVLAQAAPLRASIAPGQAATRAVREGPEVRQAEADGITLLDVVASEAGRAAGEGGTVGVIVADGALQQVTEALAAQEPATGGTLPEVQVVPVSQVHGLEFDTAVVVDPQAIRDGRDSGERDLYVALTRPTTRLVVITRT